jgi:hypothetical protein
MPDVFEVLGAAHREVEQMLDRMQAMMSVPAELRDQGGALADTLETRSPRAGSSRRPKARRCSPSWTGWPPTTSSSFR